MIPVRMKSRKPTYIPDDNGKGLYTSPFGHGDAQTGDFWTPITKGLEIFACSHNPGADYRDAATGKILMALYYRQ